LKLEPLQVLPLRQTPIPERREQSQDPRQIVHQIVYFLWRRWKFVLAVTTVALLIAQVWLATQTPRYTASAAIIFDPGSERVAGADNTSQSTSDSRTLDNQIAIVKSTSLLRRVVEAEHLVDDPEFGAKPSLAMPKQSALGWYFGQSVGPYFERAAKGTRLERLFQEIRSYFEPAAVSATSQSDVQMSADRSVKPDASQAGMLERVDATDRVEASVSALANAVTVKRIGEADVISVSVTSTDTKRAAHLANAVAQATLVDPLYARLDAGRRESGWLNERLPELRARLRESEEAVVAFRADHNLVNGGQNVTLSQEQVAQLSARLVAARADVAEKKARLDVLQSLEAQGGDVQGLPEVLNSALLASLRTQLADISLRQAGLVGRLGEGNPEVVKLRAERADVKRAIAAELVEMAQNIRNQYSLSLAQQQSIERILSDATSETNLANRTSIELGELEQAASVNRHLLEDFMKRASIVHELSGDQARSGRIIATAVAPDVPSSPNKLKVMSIALVIGLALGVSVAWAKEQLGGGFITPREAEAALGVPLLISIARMSPGETLIDGRATALPRYIRLKPVSGLSEAVRTLRVSIQMADLEKSPKVVQVTSALPGEGKTTTALMLAASLSSSGLKTLIIDADMRNPSASRYFGLDEAEGLADLLLDQTEVESAIHFNASHDLWVLPAGAKSQSADDPLTPDRVRKMVEQCRSTFDCVVVDTPPIGQVVDGRVFSGLVDKIVFVIKWGVTDKELVYRNIKLLPSPEKIAGVVFNFVDERLAKRYGAPAAAYPAVPGGPRCGMQA
jgi:polysaccharide biosynthesis transport protein